MKNMGNKLFVFQEITKEKTENAKRRKNNKKKNAKKGETNCLFSKK